MVLALSLALAPAALAQNMSFSDQTVYAGLASAHTPPVTPFTSPMIAGAGTGDFDRDGWADLFVHMGGGAPDRLFMNDQDGTFTNEAAAWGVDQAHVGGGMAIADYNNDGWTDIYSVSHGPPSAMGPGRHRLLHNNGDSTFTDRGLVAGVHLASPTNADGYGAAFGDYDLDGDLDLAVASWEFQSDGNRLFQNNGDETFTDVTTTAIPVNMSLISGFSPNFVDMNGDVWPELLWISDFGSTVYLANNADGTFANVTVAAGVGFETNGMGHAVADFDDDGLLDFYVTSILADDLTATGNMHYRNLGGGHNYSELSLSAGTKDGGWGWGTVAVDFDHDGQVDIAETNGWTADPEKEWLSEQMYLFRNLGNWTFTEMALASGLVHNAELGHGLVRLDADNDGDQDLVVVGNGQNLQYFRNELAGSGTNWLRVFLDNLGSTEVAPHGMNSRVELTAGPATKLRSIDHGGSYLASSELSAHFGVRNTTVADRIKVSWSDGLTRYLDDVPVNQTITVDHGAGWRNSSPGIVGINGEPSLTGEGTIVPGDDQVLTVRDGKPFAFTYMVLGFTELNASFKQGVLGPSPDFIVGGIPLDANGDIVIPMAWPHSAPPGSTTWWQFWMQDAAAPAGWSATNTLEATSP